MTLARPAAASITSAMTRSCSSCDRVGDSPVVPTGLRTARPLVDVPLHQPAQARLVHRPVAERRDQGHRASGEDPTFGWHAQSRGEPERERPFEEGPLTLSYLTCLMPALTIGGATVSHDRGIVETQRS